MNNLGILLWDENFEELLQQYRALAGMLIIAENGNAIRTCWICNINDMGQEPNSEWLCPCRCVGRTRWVHNRCLKAWITVQQNGNIYRDVRCPECHLPYEIIYAPLGRIARYFLKWEQRIIRWTPYILGGMVAIGGYWCAMTYGTLTCYQILGCERTRMLDATYGCALNFAAGMLPAILVGGRLIPWNMVIEDYLRNQTTTFRQLREQTLRNSEPISRVLCEALILPSISFFMGKLCLPFAQSSLQRTLLAGLTFVLSRGMVCIYVNHSRYGRYKSRCILDYNEENIDMFYYL